MAAALNIAQPTYNNWTNERTTINPKYFPDIARVCNMDLGLLIPANASLLIKTENKHDAKEFNALELYQKTTFHLEERLSLLTKENDRLLNEMSELKKKD